jgi:hypothetical protein
LLGCVIDRCLLVRFVFVGLFGHCGRFQSLDPGAVHLAQRHFGIGEARRLEGIAPQELNLHLSSATLPRLLANGLKRTRLQRTQLIDPLAHLGGRETEIPGDRLDRLAVQKHQISRVDIHLVAAAASGFSSHAEY